MKNVNEKKAICPYCSKEYKSITTNHLKTHNITRMEYLKDYDKEKYEVERIYKFIKDYYKPNEFRFIEQEENWYSKNINWRTIVVRSQKELNEQIERIKNDKLQTDASKEFNINKLKKARRYPLSKSEIIAHLKQDRTMGIFPYDKKVTSFLTFDIDEDDMEIVQKIWETLNVFGIRDEQILASWSGNKGYHLTVFFNNLIKQSYIKKLFHIIVQEANLDKLKRDNKADVVECRGAGSLLGVKLPLSINRNNSTSYYEVMNCTNYAERIEKGRGNFCYFINKAGREIDTLSRIEKMEKIDTKVVVKITEDYGEELSFEYEIDVENELDSKYEEIFKEVANEIDVDALLNNKSDMMARAKRLRNMPIEYKMRHKTLLLIAIYNKTKGLKLKDNEKDLLEFTYARKDQFETSLKENNEEIKRMLNTIYNSPSAFKYKMASTPKDIYFSKGDILEILSLRNEPLQKMYFLIMLHFKMYADFSGKEFYLGYEKMRNVLKINEGMICDRLKKLQELGKIEFVRKGEWDDPFKEDGKMKRHKKPNIYKLNYDIKYVESGFKLLCKAKNNGDNITYVNFQMMCAKKLSLDELKENFKEREGKKVGKFINQSLKEVS